MVFNENNKNMINKCKKKGILIAAHRGTVGGNIIPNTNLSFQNALLHGADIVEMDLIMSKDGIFYAFHDGEEKKILNIDTDIREMNSKELEKLCCYNSLFLKTNKHLEKVSDVLSKLKNKCFINIDRSWFFWKETINFFEQFDMGNQLILKSPVEEKLLDELEKLNSNFMYMPIITDIDQWQLVKNRNINVVAAELVFDSLDSKVCSKEFIKELKDASILLWANSIVLDDTIILSGFLDDNNSIEFGFDKGWGKLIEMDFDIIQTDWPALLSNYIQNK
jgi:glycerophosphoryl diester phosphodiesterase